MTGLYCRWMIPGLWPFTWAVALMKALQAQNLFWAPAVLTMATCILNVPLTILFMRWAGFRGAAAAPSVARIFMLLSVIGVRCGPSARGSSFHPVMLACLAQAILCYHCRCLGPTSCCCFALAHALAVARLQLSDLLRSLVCLFWCPRWGWTCCPTPSGCYKHELTTMRCRASDAAVCACVSWQQLTASPGD